MFLRWDKQARRLALQQTSSAEFVPTEPREEIGQRIAAALDTLSESDPLLVEHLEKLAVMAKK